VYKDPVYQSGVGEEKQLLTMATQEQKPVRPLRESAQQEAVAGEANCMLARLLIPTMKKHIFTT
jgi:hypothetical protein